PIRFTRWLSLWMRRRLTSPSRSCLHARQRRSVRLVGPPTGCVCLDPVLRAPAKLERSDAVGPAIRRDRFDIELAPKPHLACRELETGWQLLSIPKDICRHGIAPKYRSHEIRTPDR